jgi:hypothetical protein
VVYFFADNDGEENEIKADEIRFWDVALTEDEVGMLGAYGDVIPEPTTVAAYTAQIADGQSVNGTDYQYLALTEVEGAIPALTAVVLKADPAVHAFNIPVIEVMPDGAIGIYDDEVPGGEALVKQLANVEDNVLKGTLEPIEAAGKYVLAKPAGEEIAFYQAESGKIAAGKAYLELPAGTDVKAFYFLFPDDDATAISTVNGEESMVNGSVYNLAGQRLQKMQKGINIVNGKKIMK